MTADLILVAVIAVVGLLGGGMLLFKQYDDQKTGAKLQAATETAVSAKVAIAVAQAVVTAPSTPLAVVDQLKAGTF